MDNSDFRLEGGEFDSMACRIVALTEDAMDRLGAVVLTTTRSAALELVSKLEAEGYIVSYES